MEIGPRDVVEVSENKENVVNINNTSCRLSMIRLNVLIYMSLNSGETNTTKDK